MINWKIRFRSGWEKGASHSSPLTPIILQNSDLLQTDAVPPTATSTKDGKLDVYEESRQPIEARLENLLRQVTLQEKVGTMFIHGSDVNKNGSSMSAS